MKAYLTGAALLAALLAASCGGGPRPVVAPLSGPPNPLVRLQHDIEAGIDAPAVARGSWGIVVKSLKNDETLFSLNAGKLLMPGSTMKIVTLAAAAERLGWDHTFDTRLVAAGHVDAGTLTGDLIVVGSGDPSRRSLRHASFSCAVSRSDQITMVEITAHAMT